MKKSIYALLTLSIFMTGCAGVSPVKMYTGSYTSDQLSRIKTDSERTHSLWSASFDKRLYIIKTDDKSHFNLFSFEYPEEVIVTPGKHHLKVQSMHMGFYAIGDIWLYTEAGVDYIIRQSTQGYRVRFWAEEVGTRKVVGSITEDGIPDEEKH